MRAKFKVKNIEGRRFGKLAALYPTEKRKNGAVVWMCRCDCGNIVEVARNSLISGHIKSCGCIATEGLFKKKDIANMRFGKLVALEATEKRERECIVWRCRCDCGEYVEVSSTKLLRGTVKDCGKCGG